MGNRQTGKKGAKQCSKIHLVENQLVSNEDSRTEKHGQHGAKAASALESIERAHESARHKYLGDMALLDKVTKYNRLVAELNKIEDLTRISYKSEELCLLRYETRLLALDKDILEAKGRSVELDAKYRLEIEMPGKLEAILIKRACEARVTRVAVETEADVWSISEIGRAKIDYETAERLAEASSLRRLALALKCYYKAFVVDSLAGHILSMIALALELDPQFKLRLERPMLIGKRDGIVGLHNVRRVRKHPSPKSVNIKETKPQTNQPIG